MREGKIVVRVRGKGCMSIYGLRGAPTSNSPFHVTMICNALCLHPEGCTGFKNTGILQGPVEQPTVRNHSLSFSFSNNIRKGMICNFHSTPTVKGLRVLLFDSCFEFLIADSSLLLPKKQFIGYWAVVIGHIQG